MKFTFSIEVEAPECLMVSSGYPRHAHAQEWLFDQLREAISSRRMMIMDRMVMMKTEKGDTLDQAYIDAQENIITELTNAMKTVKHLDRKCPRCGLKPLKGKK